MMKMLLKNNLSKISLLGKKLGIDNAILYTAFYRIIQAAGGLVTVVCIASKLTTAEQGYYYTFASIVAIQLFFELGFSAIITQYVAHEASHLNLNGPLHAQGKSYYLSRLSSLLRFCFKWYLAMSSLFFLILILLGRYFFSKFDKGNNVEWLTPWTIISAANALFLFISPFLSFLEGLGKVKEVAKIRLTQQSIFLILVWTLLLSNAKLYAAGISLLISVILITILLLFSPFKSLLYKIWKAKGDDVIHYRKEILPYQLKTAISWMASYFIFQLFNPVLFAYEGPEIAGRMGMTLTVLNSILSLAMSWVSTKLPVWSGFIAQKKYAELDLSFNKTIRQSTFICFSALSILLLLVQCCIYLDIKIIHKLLPTFPFILLSITILCNNTINAWATYLRCHKKEPFLFQAIGVGLLCGASTLYLGQHFGLQGLTIGYFIITLFVSTPWAYYIFITKKKRWHEV